LPKGSKDYTHTSIQGGIYKISDDKQDEFWNLYTDFVIKKGNPEYLTERQDLKGGSMYVDLDFRFSYDVECRQYKKGHIDIFIMQYLEFLKEYYVFDKNTKFPIFVMERDDIYRMPDSSLTKDGIHLQFGFYVDRNIQKEIREKMIKFCEQNEDEVDIPFNNSWDSVFDDGITKGTTNIQMFGSRKPDRDAYKLTYAYEITLDETDNEFMMDALDISQVDYKQLFIHNTNIPKYQSKKVTGSSSQKQKKSRKLENFIIQDETDTESTDEEDKYLDLLYNVCKVPPHRQKDRALWLSVAGCLSYSYDDKVWEKWCDNNKINFDNEKSKIIDYLKPNAYEHSINGLEKIARSLNYDGYKNWLVNHKHYADIQIFEKGENDVAKFIAPYLKTTLIYCEDKWFLCNNKNLWNVVKEPTATIVSAIQEKIDEAMECICNKINNTQDEAKKKEFIELRCDYLANYRKVTKSSFSCQVCKMLKDYLHDTEFIKKLDNSLYKMVFKNGVMDLKTMQFSNGIQKEDYVTKTIPFDYTENTNTSEVRNIIKKICNWNEEHLEYYLSSIGYAFTGDRSKEQNFWYLRGETASNGKSIIFETLEELMPNYVMKANKDFMDKGADVRKEIATWIGLKLLWVNELSTKEKDEDLTKAVADGTSYKYNRLYATEAVTMPITFKLFAVSNNSLTIKGDAGVKRRFRLMQFNSQFQASNKDDDYENRQFIMDNKLPDKLKGKYRDALIYLIMQYANKYYNSGIAKYPDDWNEDAKEVMEDNNKFEEWFMSNYEMTPDGVTWKRDLETMATHNNFKHIKVKDELKRMKVIFKYESQAQGTGKDKGKKGCFRGFKYIEETEPIHTNI